VNTLVLLTSSWFIARGVQAARSGDHNGAVATMSRQTKKNKELRGQLSDN
jgi:heme/copper-type cytochrome/quinol oxidase subunit 3